MKPFSFEGYLEAFGHYESADDAIWYSAINMRDARGKKQTFNKVYVGPNAGTQMVLGTYVRMYFTQGNKGGLFNFAVASGHDIYEDIDSGYQGVESQRRKAVYLLSYAIISFVLVDMLSPLKGGGFVFVGWILSAGPFTLIAAIALFLGSLKYTRKSKLKEILRRDGH